MEEDSVSQSSLEAEAFNMLGVGDTYEYSWACITSWLQEQFKVNPLEGINLKFSEDNIHELLRILEVINGKFAWYNSLEVPIQECLTETLKSLRTYVINEEVAIYLVKDPMFDDIIDKLMECVFTKKNGQELYTKYLLQLFLNLLSVGSDQQRKKARDKIKKFGGRFRQNFISAYGYIYETSAVLYNILCDVNITDEDLINCIILYHADVHKTNEYLDFLMEQLISSDFVWQIYERLNFNTRLALLSCLKEVLICPSSDNIILKVNVIPVSCLECFVTVFNKSANVVFQVTQAGCTDATQEVSYILELLSHLSSQEKYLGYLQNNKDTFINAGVLLLNVHRLGKMPNNVFTPIQKLAQNENQGGETRNPVFGFKADLVRLIGNLCWKNRRMQDLAREAEVIPVLLDSCNIDQKNPFIIQWVILAIRNICENNLENQAIIAGLTNQGVIGADVLQKCGLTLHAEEDLSIGIIGLDLNK